MIILLTRDPETGAEFVIQYDSLKVRGALDPLVMGELPLPVGLSGFWGNLWDGIKRAGGWIRRVHETAGPIIDAVTDYWSQRDARNACISDPTCGFFRVARIGSSGVIYESIASCGSRKVVQSRDVPHWQPPACDLPISHSPDVVFGTDGDGIEAWLPWAAAAAVVLFAVAS